MAATWRKLYTKATDNTFLMNDNNAWVVFTKLLIRVNGKGELATSIRDLSDYCNLPSTTLHRALHRLEAEHIIVVIATERGKRTIIKIRNWSIYQSTTKQGSNTKAEQNVEQQPEQLFTDEVSEQPEQQPEQDMEHRRNSGGTAAEQNGSKKQGSENPLDIDKEYRYKEFVIFDIQLVEEIKGFIDARKKKDKGFTQRALDLNINKLKKFYPDDIEMQRTAINESVARGWSGIFELKDRPDSTSSNHFKEAFRKYNANATS